MRGVRAFQLAGIDQPIVRVLADGLQDAIARDRSLAQRDEVPVDEARQGPHQLRALLTGDLRGRIEIGGQRADVLSQLVAQRFTGFEAALAYTWLDARFEEPFTGGTPPRVVPAGNKIPGVPPERFYGELIWRHARSGFHAGVEALHNGKVYVNDANSEFAGAYTVWNLRAGFEQKSRAWRLTQFVRVDNVADREYIGSVIVNEANRRYYEPAPGRNWLAGLTAEHRF